MEGKRNKKAKVGIIGLGPVGMILAVHLQETGCEVVLFDKDKVKINQIRQEGIALDGVIKKRAYFNNICTSLAEFLENDFGFLVFAVKAHHTPGLLSEMAGLCKAPFAEQFKGLKVISAQNGMDVEHQLSVDFGEANTLRMIVNFAGNLNAPNAVKITFFNPPNYLASIDDSSTEAAQQFAGWLNKIALKTETINSFELIRREWEKTILNASLSPLCGMGKFTIKEAMDFPDTVEIVEQIIEEALEVAEAEKIKFEDDFIRKCLRYLKKAGNHFPSLAVDLINNRETEIDFINGKIVEYGRKHYIRTSLNLVFTNMVKAMTQKNLVSGLSGADLHLLNKRQNGLNIRKNSANGSVKKESGACFMGVDLGSAYTKIVLIDEHDEIIYKTILQTLNRDKVALKHVIEALQSEYDIAYSCATGYGRKYFADAEMTKTEINCAAAGVSRYFPGSKNIIDIGGEDIKVINCDVNNHVDNFYLNDKCAAGTGSFITEIAERAGVSISEMSDLASKSNYDKELNSFCTVFAKTEIMKWIFDGLSVEDAARGIYISISNRIAKMRIEQDLPIYMIGGVIAHHPYLKDLLEERYKQEVTIVDQPQYIVSNGAALIAKEYYQKKGKTLKKAIV